MKMTLITSVALACSASADTLNFDAADTGKAPPGWTATKTGTG